MDNLVKRRDCVFVCVCVWGGVRKRRIGFRGKKISEYNYKSLIAIEARLRETKRGECWKGSQNCVCLMSTKRTKQASR